MFNWGLILHRTKQYYNSSNRSVFMALLKFYKNMKGEIILRTSNKLELDVYTKKVRDVLGKGIHFVTDDVNAYKIEFKLLDNGVAIDLTGKSIVIAFKRANRTVFLDDDIVITTADEGECEYIVKPDAIAVPGPLYFEIYIYTGTDSRITTPIAVASVRGDIDNEDAIAGTSEYPILAQILEKTRVFAAGSFYANIVISGVSSDIFISPFAGYGLTHWALYINGIRVSDVITTYDAVRVNVSALSNINALTVRLWNTDTPPNPDAPWSDDMFQPWSNSETWGQWLDDNTFQVEAAFHPFVNSTIEDGNGFGLLVS